MAAVFVFGFEGLSQHDSLSERDSPSKRATRLVREIQSTSVG
jgi:hypothetical protein